MTAMATHLMRKQIAAVGVPDVPDLLDQIVASGGHLWACRMSADMMHLTLGVVARTILGVEAEAVAADVRAALDEVMKDYAHRFEHPFLSFDAVVHYNGDAVKLSPKAK